MSERYSQVIEGENLIWNNKFEEADKLFETRKDSPRYALHYAESAFLRSFITADQEDTHVAMERLKRCKELAEEAIKNYERGAPGDKNDVIDARIVYGDALYMIAILQMTRDAKIKGAFNLRKSWKTFEKALKESKGAEGLDVEISRSLQFGAGFFLFAMSIIPQKFLKLVELAGFKADKDVGLQYIKECHKNGGVRGPFATMVLLFNNLLLPRGLANASQYLVEADALIQESLKKYPQGSLFHVMGSHCARKQCDVDKGIKLMEIALENCKSLKQPPLIYRYELANCYQMKLDFKKAAEIYAPLIDVPKFQVRVLCSLQLAACYVMMGEREKANHLFAKLQTISNKGHLDSTVVRQAKRYLSNGGHFSAFELLYLRRDLAKMQPVLKQVLIELGKQAESTKATEKMTPASPPPKEEKKSKLSMSGFGRISGQFQVNLSKIPFVKKKDTGDSSFDDRASYLLLRGSIVKALGQQDEAIACFQEVCEELADQVTEKLYIPYCLYELGESYYTIGKLKEAEEMMKRCSKHSGYDWEDPLRVRLRVTMEQLKKGTAPPTETQALTLDALANQELPNIEEKEDDYLEGSDDESEYNKLSEE